MPKFKDKVIKKYFAGSPEDQFREYDKSQYNKRFAIPALRDIEPERPKSLAERASYPSTLNPKMNDVSNFLSPILGQQTDQPAQDNTDEITLPAVTVNELLRIAKSNLRDSRNMPPAPKAVNTSVAKSVNTKKPVAPVANVSPADILKSVTNSNSEFLQGMDNSPADLTNAMSAYGKPTTPTIPDIGKSIKEGIKSSSAAPDMAKAAGELPKTKSGMKKFMDEYGKFIALGALAGAGGKKGMIAAPIMAALPGILKMLQNRGKKTPGVTADDAAAMRSAQKGLPTSGGDYAHGGLLGNKSAAHPKKKMVGGSIRKFSGGKLISKLIEKMESEGDSERAGMLRQNIPNKYMKYMSKPTQGKSSLNSSSPGITIIGEESDDYKYLKGGTVRKFKGGSTNTMKENLMPKYKKGGDMPKGMPKEMMAMMGKKGKATGDMPEHKKMDMGMPIGKMPDSKKMGMAKPKPSSMNQKFAKGGTARYASGGMCKGNGIAKKIRSTGVMN